MKMNMLGIPALALLLALPAVAQEKENEKEKDVRVIVKRGDGPDMMVLRQLDSLPEPMLAGSGALPAPAYGIPAHLVEKLGLPKDLVQKVRDLSFQANDALIGLEADLKRAQLALERELRQDSPREQSVMDLVDQVGRAETAVRKNRMGLMLQVKRLLGPDNWRKLEAEMGSGLPHKVVIEKRIGHGGEEMIIEKR